MLTAAQTLDEDLTALTGVQALINGKQFWELAPKDEKGPLVTYSIKELVRSSKDRQGRYTGTVRCFAKSMSAAAEIAELIKSGYREQNYSYLGGESGYTDSEGLEGYVELRFDFVPNA